MPAEIMIPHKLAGWGTFFAIARLSLKRYNLPGSWGHIIELTGDQTLSIRIFIMSSSGVGWGDGSRKRNGCAANTFSEKPHHNLVAILSRDTNQISFFVPSLEGLGITWIGPHLPWFQKSCATRKLCQNEGISLLLMPRKQHLKKIPYWFTLFVSLVSFLTPKYNRLTSLTQAKTEEKGYWNKTGGPALLYRRSWLCQSWGPGRWERRKMARPLTRWPLPSLQDLQGILFGCSRSPGGAGTTSTSHCGSGRWSHQLDISYERGNREHNPNLE